METINSKHLKKGDPCPPLVPGKLRIYNMRFCPYAHRALLVAEAKKIPYDVVNCNLFQKPDWLFEKNPLAKVPTIELGDGNNGTCLYESLIVCDYMDEVYSSTSDRLNSPDPLERAKDRILIELFSSTVASMDYKGGMLPPESSDSDVKSILQQLVDSLKPFEEELAQRGGKFFGKSEEKPGMVDYMIWPWFERFPVQGLMWGSHFNVEEKMKDYTRLNAWKSRMMKDPAVAKLYLSPEVLQDHRIAKKRGNEDFDLILKIHDVTTS